MRVFVYECMCCTARAEDPFTSLHTEGWAMLSAALFDFSDCPGVQTVILSDPEIAGRFYSFKTSIRPFDPSEEECTFRALAADCDWTLVIAPECDAILAERCLWVEEAGGRLLGPSSAAVRLTGDKLALACHWRDQGIPTPTTIEATSRPPSHELPFPLVCKPRFGAGSWANFLIHNEEQWAHALPQAQEWAKQLIVQPYCPGLAVSVSFLAGEKERFALPAVEQHLSADGRFRYRGGRLPLPQNLDERARRLAEKAVATVQGLRGYFGVDLVLGDAEDGSADAVIEINPRFTTSYIGLRRLARFNLAKAVLAIVTNGQPPSWDWQIEPVVFAADGRILPLTSSQASSP